MHTQTQDRQTGRTAERKASVGQVAATMFWALFMIGKKGTWEREGAVITLPQVVIGAVVGGIVLILTLMLIVSLVLS